MCLLRNKDNFSIRFNIIQKRSFKRIWKSANSPTPRLINVVVSRLPVWWEISFCSEGSIWTLQSSMSWVLLNSPSHERWRCALPLRVVFSFLLLFIFARKKVFKFFILTNGGACMSENQAPTPSFIRPSHLKKKNICENKNWYNDGSSFILNT